MEKLCYSRTSVEDTSNGHRRRYDDKSGQSRGRCDCDSRVTWPRRLWRSNVVIEASISQSHDHRGVDSTITGPGRCWDCGNTREINGDALGQSIVGMGSSLDQ